MPGAQPSVPVPRPAAVVAGRRRRRVGRGRGLGALVLAAAMSWSAPAEAAPPDDRPWVPGWMVPRLVLGSGGLFGDVPRLRMGLAGEYYVANGLAVGLELVDTIYFYQAELRRRYEGLENNLPTNAFEMVPTLRWVFFRSRRFSPYVLGGVGPVFANRGVGTHGVWVGQPGVLVHLRGPLYVDLGLRFSQPFPLGRCNDATAHTRGVEDRDLDDPAGFCSFKWQPVVGFLTPFGDRRARRKREQLEERSTPPPHREPASNPLGEAAPESPPRTEPIELVPPDESPTDVAAPPSETPPTDAAPLSDAAPTDGATPPSETPPPDAAPPGDAAPTDVAAPGDAAPTDAAAPGDEAPADVAPPPSATTSGAAPQQAIPRPGS